MLFAFGQDSTECQLAIRRVFKILQNTQELMRTGILIDYKTLVCLSPENGSKCGEDSAQLIMKNKKSALLGNQKRIYRDDSIQVVIMDDRKQIIITTMRVIDKDKLPQLNFTGIQDSLIYTSQYIDCKLEMIGSDTCYSATLQLSKKIQKQIGIAKAHYLVNKTKGVMRKIEIEYIEGKQFKTASFDLKKVDYKYGKEPFNGSALQTIFDNQGRLLKSYESYTLTDLRKANDPAIKMH